LLPRVNCGTVVTWLKSGMRSRVSGERCGNGNGRNRDGMDDARVLAVNWPEAVSLCVFFGVVAAILIWGRP